MLLENVANIHRLVTGAVTLTVRPGHLRIFSWQHGWGFSMVVAFVSVFNTGIAVGSGNEKFVFEFRRVALVSFICAIVCAIVDEHGNNRNGTSRVID